MTRPLSPAKTATELARALEKHRGSLRIPEAFDLAIETMFLDIRREKGLCRDDELHTRLRTRLEKEAPELTMGFTTPLRVAIVDHDIGADILGRVASHASTLDKSLGQFFTPPDLARLCVALSTDTASLLAKYREHGIVTMHEPTIGSGVMAMAWVEAAVESGIPRDRLYIDGWDIEASAARMAYVQLALHGIPAQIVLGDVLSREIRAVWETPALVVRRQTEAMSRILLDGLRAMEAPGEENGEEEGDDLAPAA